MRRQIVLFTTLGVLVTIQCPDEKTALDVWRNYRHTQDFLKMIMFKERHVGDWVIEQES